MPSVFVTVGTTEFPALAHAVFAPGFAEAVRRQGCDAVEMQIGRLSPDALPAEVRDALARAGGDEDKHAAATLDWNSMPLTVFRFKASIQPSIESAALVVSHAGAGSVFECLRARKRLLVVVNDDLMDNHQQELAKAMAGRGHLAFCSAGDASVAAALGSLPAAFEPLGDPATSLSVFASVVADELGTS